MSKRKVDEAETTCGTWLTARKQDLKEFESNIQRLSQRRSKLLRLSKRPVVMVTAVKQSKLSDFFPNFTAGKENSCNNYYNNANEKPQKVKGQIATIDGMWANVKFKEASSKKHIPLSAVNQPSSPVNRGCYHVSEDDASMLQCKTDRYDLDVMNQHRVLNYDKDSSNRPLEAGHAKRSKLRSREGSSCVMDNKSSCKNSLNSYDSLGNETDSSYINASDNFHRITPNHKIHGIGNSEDTDTNSVETPEDVHVRIMRNDDAVTGLIIQNNCKRHQSLLEPDFKNVSKVNEETSEILPESSQSLASFESVGMIDQSVPSSVETLPNDGYSLGSLRFTVDTEEQILKLQESSPDSENLKVKLHAFDSKEPILNMPESCLESEDFKLQDSHLETEGPNIIMQGFLLDCEEPIINFQDSSRINNHILQKKPNNRQKENQPYFEDFYQLELTQEKGSNTTIDSLNETDHNFSLFSNSLELVEDSQGCLQVKRS